MCPAFTKVQGFKHYLFQKVIFYGPWPTDAAKQIGHLASVLIALSIAFTNIFDRFRNTEIMFAKNNCAQTDRQHTSSHKTMLV